MRKQNSILAAALASLVAAPIAADVIAYRTDDGVFAYTDDHDKVPARYAADAVTVHDTALHTYPRLTVEEPEARAVTSRLEKRLDYLRQVNAASAAEREVAAQAAAKAAQSTVISIPTGPTLGKDGHGIPAPSVEVATGGGGGAPVVVEPILTKEGDRVRTRRATVVRQGDKVLAILKGRSHHVDVNSDIYDEDALEGK
ncbi:MAG TPA: hypothetical protein VKH41_16465 [Myxococcota bacterium]|nr:hypothetical protein [Myxococcota bacterium]